MKLDGQIYNKGEITITSRLEPDFYNYPDGVETLAFDRISAALYVVEQVYDCCLGGVSIKLGTTVPVGGEVAASKIWQWLVVYVSAVDKRYKDKQEFADLLERIAYRVLDALVITGKHSAAIEIIPTESYYAVITNDD